MATNPQVTEHAAERPSGASATYMSRHSGATGADARNKADEIVAHLMTADFSTMRVVEKPMKPMPAVCVLATKTRDDSA